MTIDRTKEFEDLLSFFSPNKSLPQQNSSVDRESTTDFVVALTSVAAQFEQTQRHIGKLQKLVDQRSSFYKEPTGDIEALSLLFDSDDKQIETQLEMLSKWLSRNTVVRSQSRKHGETIVETLKSRRAKFALNFQASLKKRTEVLKRKVRRQSQFGTESSRRRELTMGSPLFTFPTQQAPPLKQEGPPPGQKILENKIDNNTNGPNYGSQGMREKPKNSYLSTATTKTTAIAADAASARQAGGSGAGGVRRRRQQQQMSQMLLQEEEEEQHQQALDGALKRRNTARGIESEIEKLGEVFQRFSSLVVEQGESLRVIDVDVEAAAFEVEEGQKHIAKTYTITQGNRGVIIKIFATILFLAFLLVYF